MVINVIFFNNLGSLINPKLNFHVQILSVASKYTFLVGLIKRWCKEFVDACVTKKLHVALIKPLPEHAAIILSLNNIVCDDVIEFVQKPFAKFALRPLCQIKFDKIYIPQELIYPPRSSAKDYCP